MKVAAACIKTTTFKDSTATLCAPRAFPISLTEPLSFGENLHLGQLISNDDLVRMLKEKSERIGDLDNPFFKKHIIFPATSAGSTTNFN